MRALPELALRVVNQPRVLAIRHLGQLEAVVLHCARCPASRTALGGCCGCWTESTVVSLPKDIVNGSVTAKGHT